MNQQLRNWATRGEIKMIIKYLMSVILLFNIYGIQAKSPDSSEFSKFAKESYSTLIVSVREKTRIDSEDVCIKVTANILESSSNIAGEITFWTTREEDFLHEVEPYLVFLYQGKKYSDFNCSNEPNELYALSSVQSMFPILDRSFCHLEGDCEFLIVRESIFDNESKFGRRMINSHIYDVDRIYAKASISNLKKTVVEAKGVVQLAN